MSTAEISAILLSLKVALFALVLTLPLAIIIAYALSRKKFPGHQIVNALVLLPLVMPPVVTGYILLLLFGKTGAIGGFLYNWFGVQLAFNWVGAALASAIMAFPLIVRPIKQAFDSADQGLEHAARSLGASKIRCWTSVTLPLAMPGIIAGAVLGFAKALGEFGATITFAANIPGETRTIALAIHTELQRPGGEGIAIRLTIVSIFIAVAAVILSEVFLARKQGSDHPKSGDHDESTDEVEAKNA